MDPPESLEIYIPVEAEVNSILLWSLPNPVLRQMGLRLPDAELSRMLAKSPEGIWISPVFLRRKGQKCTSPTGNDIIGNMSSVIGRVSQATPGPCPMSFVSSCNTAFKVLKDTSPGKTVPVHTPHISKFPPASATQTYQNAVVIYDGHVYLSIRKTCRSQRHLQTNEPQSLSLPSTTSTSDMSSKSQKASLEPADKAIQRKGQHLSQITSNQPKDLLTEADHSMVDQEHLQEHLHDATSLQQKADYKELAQEEEIARLKAKLRRSNAALNSLHSSEQQQ